jgi:hypothetical protein
LQYFSIGATVRFGFSSALLTKIINENFAIQRSTNIIDLLDKSTNANLVFSDTMASSDGHKILNEARKSAIGLAAFAVSLLNTPFEVSPKVAFFDDVLVGIDMSHRMPIIKLIKEKFIESGWQIFITTFDRAWYNLFKTQIQKDSWKFYEFYTNPLVVGGKTIDKPVLIVSDTHRAKALSFLSNFDYPSAANMFRKEAEMLLTQDSLCPIFYRGPNGEKLTSLRNLIELHIDLGKQLSLPVSGHEELKTMLEAILNPLSHQDQGHAYYKSEFAIIENALNTTLSYFRVVLERLFKRLIFFRKVPFGIP